MDILKSNKKRKIILFCLGIIFILFISRFLYFSIYDSININKCTEYNSNVIIQFSGYKVTDTKKLKIQVIQKGNLKREIKHYKINSLSVNELSYYLDGKILKTDTLLIKLNDQNVKIFDFRNEGWRQKYGKDRGKFNCYHYMKINGQEYRLESDTIYLTPKDLLPETL